MVDVILHPNLMKKLLFITTVLSKPRHACLEGSLASISIAVERATEGYWG